MKNSGWTGESPLVSIVIPCYNSEQYIEKYMYMLEVNFIFVTKLLDLI